MNGRRFPRLPLFVFSRRPAARPRWTAPLALLAAWALLAAAPISAAPAGLASGAPSVPGDSTRAAEEPATETATDASADSVARACGGGGNRSYYFSGLLKVRHDGNTEPLEGVQLRIVRKGSPLKWAQGPDAVTDENGKFQVECTFARDRNGVVPWGKKIRFKVMARFRDGNFKVRKGGWAKNNWFEVAQREGCKKNGCKQFSFTLNGDERAASKTFDTGTLAGKHAYLWRFYNTLQDEMKQEGVGLTDRPGFRRKLTITYPDRNIRRWWSENIQNESSNSWFLFNVHLAEGDWDRQETMIHEWMHRWDVEHTRGSASLVCLFDKHHKAPNNTNAAAKCSGFMEGFAEATAQALNQAHFGAGSPDAFTHEQMREGDADSYEVNTLSEAQRTDIGWQNFLTALWTSNKGAFVSDASSPSGSCFTPKTLGVYDVLQAIKRERPRKAKWLVSGNSTFEWFTGVLEKQVSDFGAKDARFYQLLGDPSITGSDLQAEMCGEGMETSKEPLADAGAASGDFGGVWDTDFGELRLHQIGDYVIGDYADNGVMVGKAGGTCVAGVLHQRGAQRPLPLRRLRRLRPVRGPVGRVRRRSRRHLVRRGRLVAQREQPPDAHPRQHARRRELRVRPIERPSRTDDETPLSGPRASEAAPGPASRWRGPGEPDRLPRAVRRAGLPDGPMTRRLSPARASPRIRWQCRGSRLPPAPGWTAHWTTRPDSWRC